MRYAIEIYVIKRDGAKDVLHRTLVERINPAGARKEARRLFELFKRRNGVARLINSKGQTLYTVTE